MQKKSNILTRVNTVVGLNNFRFLPQLRSEFSRIGVDAWEVTPVKLDKKVPYSLVEREELKRIIFELYRDASSPFPG